MLRPWHALANRCIPPTDLIIRMRKESSPESGTGKKYDFFVGKCYAAEQYKENGEE
jgi:hypothetical protein